MRRLVALFLVLAVFSTGCGDDDDAPVVDPTQEPDDIPAVDVPTDADDYIGLTVDEATAKAEADGRVLRILRVDDEQFAVTDDFIDTRINLEIDDGEVTAASYG